MRHMGSRAEAIRHPEPPGYDLRVLVSELFGLGQSPSRWHLRPTQPLSLNMAVRASFHRATMLITTMLEHVPVLHPCGMRENGVEL